MPNVWLVVIQLVMLFLRNVKDHENCPDGVCDEALAEGATLKTQLQSPGVSFGIFDMFRFLRCFPMDRVFAVMKRVVDLLKGCQQCPDGDCSLFDILSCLDLKEAVAIAQEILAIIRDSQVCDGDGGNEITLGQAAS
jgi:hypothetical protein